MRWRAVPVTAAIVDAALMDLGYTLAFRARFGADVPLQNLLPFLEVRPYVWVAAIVVFWTIGLYSSQFGRPVGVVQSAAIGALVIDVTTVAAVFFLRGFAFPRSVFLMGLVLQVILVTSAHLVRTLIVEALLGRKNVVIIADQAEANTLSAKVESSLGRLHSVVSLTDIRCTDLCGSLGVADVVVVGASVPEEAREKALRACLDAGSELFVVPRFYDILVHNAVPGRIDDVPAFHIPRFSLGIGQRLVKRLFDLVFACVLLVPAVILGVGIAAIIVATSPGPPLYFQKRIGERGRPFTLVKFRTMVVDAERDTGPVLAIEGDARITPVGRFLRATRLDELPQLVNVLRGEMSFVGPRPERPEFVDRYAREADSYYYRFLVKPGITGLAQVEGRYDTEAIDKLGYDLYYIRNYSLLLDIQILLRTLKVLVMPASARGLNAHRSPRARAKATDSVHTSE